MKLKTGQGGDRFPLKMAGGLAALVLLLAGILGGRGVLPPSGILAMVALGVGGFVAVALRDRWKRIRWNGGEIEMKKHPTPPPEDEGKPDEPKDA